MNCLLCHKEDHSIMECQSVRSQTVEDAINHWTDNCLIQIYTSIESMERITQVSSSAHFRRLSLGDTIYLNKSWIESPIIGWTRDAYIALFLAKKIENLYLYDNTQGQTFTEGAQEQMRIDYGYWAQRCYIRSDDEIALLQLNQWRTQQIEYYYAINHEMDTNSQTSIQYTSIEVESEILVDCAICLREGLDQIHCLQLQCKHSFCNICIKHQLENGKCICALCRADIKIITSFLSPNLKVTDSCV